MIFNTTTNYVITLANTISFLVDFLKRLTKYFWLKNLVCRARTTESSVNSPSRCIRSVSSANLFFLASSAATRSLLRNRSPIIG